MIKVIEQEKALNSQIHQSKECSQILIAKGLRRASYSQTDSGGSWSFKDESEWVYTKVPAIVDEEIFDKVNIIITLQHSTRKKPVKQPIHAFSGLVFCSCNDMLR